jgi:hypothetical protein
MNQGFVPPPLPTQPQPSQVIYNPPGRRRRSMLAWWAALPLIPFAIVESLYGWQIALVRATSADFAGSYLAGAIFGGVLIPFVVAYVVYRIASRSQFAASLTFSIVLLLLCASVYLQGNPGRGHLGTPGIATTPTIHHFTNVEFETTGGWMQIQGSHETNVATLILSGQSRSEPDGMIMVDAGKPKGDMRQNAASLAEADGRVLPNPVLVDSVQGLRVETTSTDTSRPKLAVVLLRNDRMYLIMAAGAHGYDVTPDFERVLKTWKWKD